MDVEGTRLHDSRGCSGVLTGGGVNSTDASARNFCTGLLRYTPGDRAASCAWGWIGGLWERWGATSATGNVALQQLCTPRTSINDLAQQPRHGTRLPARQALRNAHMRALGGMRMGQGVHSMQHREERKGLTSERGHASDKREVHVEAHARVFNTCITQQIAEQSSSTCTMGDQG